MTRITRDTMLAKIRGNIERYGHHGYLIVGKQAPRFAYTIGVSARGGYELVLAGAASYTNQDVKRVIDALAGKDASRLRDGAVIELDGLGIFSLRPVDGTWAASLVLGAIDYYHNPELPVLQIVPDEDHWTIDVPDCTKPLSPEREPVWKWLTEPWPYPVSDRSMAVTNLDALRGEPVTEAMRWEDDQWELFAGEGPEVPRDEIREVPLGTLIGADPSLAVVTELVKGTGCWRDPMDMVWKDWKCDPPVS